LYPLWNPPVDPFRPGLNSRGLKSESGHNTGMIQMDRATVGFLMTLHPSIRPGGWQKKNEMNHTILPNKIVSNF
jgi:hypothetical protein